MPAFRASISMRVVKHSVWKGAITTAAETVTDLVSARASMYY